jgi:hypothetical protein
MRKRLTEALVSLPRNDQDRTFAALPVRSTLERADRHAVVIFQLRKAIRCRPAG